MTHMKNLLKHILPNRQRVLDAISQKGSQHLIIVENNGEILRSISTKHPTTMLDLHAQMLDNAPSTARVKSAANILKGIRHKNKQTYLGSPTFNDDELDELDNIYTQLEDIIDRAVNRWQLDKPKSPFEKESPELSKKMKQDGVVKTPKSKPYMKIIK